MIEKLKTRIKKQTQAEREIKNTRSKIKDEMTVKIE